VAVFLRKPLIFGSKTATAWRFFFLGETHMTPIDTPEAVFQLGMDVGRKQAFTLVGGRCSAAAAEYLREIRNSKRYRTLDLNWEQFCTDILGISRSFADNQIRLLEQLGPNYHKLNSFTHIKPAEYRLISGAVTDEGISYSGAIIPIESENAAQLAEAVSALRREAAPAPDPVDPAEQAFAKAEKSLEAAIAAFARLQEMNLDQEGRLRLVIAVEGGREHLDRIRTTTSLD
jgi:hypothetical protein